MSAWRRTVSTGLCSPRSGPPARSPCLAYIDTPTLQPTSIESAASLIGFGISWTMRRATPSGSSSSAAPTVMTIPNSSPPSRATTQHLISKAMAVKVIDRFEMIEIEHEQGTALILTGVSRLGVKLFQKPPAIGEPGQRVVAREPLSILFGRTPLFHLLTEIQDTAHREDDGCNANKKQESDELVELVFFVTPAVCEDEVEGIDPNQKCVSWNRKRQDDHEIELGARHSLQPAGPSFGHADPTPGCKKF